MEESEKPGFFFLFYSIQFKDKNIKEKNMVHMHFVDEYFSRYIHSLCNRP